MKIFLMILAALMALCGGASADDSATARRQRIETKLDAITLPPMEFKDVSLRQALDEIHRAAAKADSGAGEASKGMNFVLKLEEGPEKLVSVHFPGGSLRAALTQLATAAALKIKAESYGVALVPKDEFTDELVTREYTEPKAVILSWREKKEGAPSAREILLAEGLEFPPGSSAYVNGSGKLVIRNSETNLKAIETFLARQANQP